jgi:ANTH domain
MLQIKTSPKHLQSKSNYILPHTTIYIHRTIVAMRFLLTISILLWVQRQSLLTVSAKKPSRPLPSSNRLQQQRSTQAATSTTASSRSGRTSTKSNEKQRKQTPRSIIKNNDDDFDVDEIDTFDGTPEDDDDDDDHEKVIPRPSNHRNQRKPPVRTAPTKDNSPPNQKRQSPISKFDDVDDDEENFDDTDEDEDFEDDEYVPPQRQERRIRPQQRPAFVGRRNGAPPPVNRNTSSSSSRTNQRPRTPRPTSSRGRNVGGRVVPYSRPPPPGYGAAVALAQGWSGLVSVLPDPNSVKEAALNSINAAKQTTSSLSANIYREVKGLTSSELEQVMLKATRPDDTPVKGKHVERLVGVTYQISSRYDIYDAVLRKLWSKMAERDWRTTVKALYILHRFAADGSPDHAPALKARLRELRRTRDPKRKDKFFNMKQILAGDITPDNVPYRTFMSRYANYVLLRTQFFSGMFDEISSVPQSATKSDNNNKKKTVTPTKPITSTSLRNENLNAAEMILKAGLACQLKDGAICENTAIAAERVVSDMIGLTSAVAMALNRVLKDIDNIPKGTDLKLIQLWCIFYSQQLLPQTKIMVKKMSPNLDAFGLFLPSRMGTSVAPNLLEKGLNLNVLAEGNDTVDENTDTSTTETIEPVRDTLNKIAATTTTTVSDDVSVSEKVDSKPIMNETDSVNDEYDEEEVDDDNDDEKSSAEDEEDEEYDEDDDEEYEEDDDDDDA